MNGNNIFDTYYEVFQDSVIKASFIRPILADIWAKWCSPCVVLAPVLELVIADYAGAIGLAKIDVDYGENMKIAGQFKVRGFPTVILFQDGEEKGRFYGARTKDQVKTFIEGLISDLHS